MNYQLQLSFYRVLCLFSAYDQFHLNADAVFIQIYQQIKN